MKNNFTYTKNGIEVDISEAVHCGDETKEIQPEEAKSEKSHAQLLTDIANKKDLE